MNRLHSWDEIYFKIPPPPSSPPVLQVEQQHDTCVHERIGLDWNNLGRDHRFIR